MLHKHSFQAWRLPYVTPLLVTPLSPPPILKGDSGGGRGKQPKCLHEPSILTLQAWRLLWTVPWTTSPFGHFSSWSLIRLVTFPCASFPCATFPLGQLSVYRRPWFRGVDCCAEEFSKSRFLHISLTLRAPYKKRDRINF